MVTVTTNSGVGVSKNFFETMANVYLQYFWLSSCRNEEGRQRIFFYCEAYSIMPGDLHDVLLLARICS